MKNLQHPNFAQTSVLTKRPNVPAKGLGAEEVVLALLLPTLVTAFLWSTSVQDVSLLQAGCAWLLLCFPWASYLIWKRQKRYEVSLFAFVAAIYWVYYGVALFYGKRMSPTIAAHLLSNQAITQSMLMAVLGVTCLWAGTQMPLGRLGIPRRIPDVPQNPSNWNYIRVLLVLGIIFSFFPGTTNLLGTAGRQVMLGLQTTVPLVAFLILFRHYLTGAASRIDKVLAALFLISSFMVGVASGWLGTFILIAIGCLVVYLREKRRIPWLALLPVLLYVVFFQAGKAEYRAHTWSGAAGQSGIIERVDEWFSLSLSAWQGAFDDPTGEKRAELIDNVVMRASLLTQTANVVEQTPAYTPYQMGSTYSYLAAMWVPRALWPGKPSANDANRFYQVAYGLTAQEDLDSVAIASGTLTEAYINFGWFGVALIMFLVGILFNWVQRIFLVRQSGWLFGAIGIMLVLNFITIESQMAMYVGGIAQRTVLVLLVFLPILHLRKLR